MRSTIFGASALALSMLCQPAASASVSAQASPTTFPIPTGAKRPVQSKATRDCATLCAIPFYKVPAGQLLEIDVVSCGTTVENANPQRFFLLSASFNVLEVPTAIVSPTIQTDVGGGRTFFSGDIHGPFFFSGGQGVYAIMPADDAKPFCTFSGYISPAQ